MPAAGVPSRCCKERIARWCGGELGLLPPPQVLTWMSNGLQPLDLLKGWAHCRSVAGEIEDTRRPPHLLSRAHRSRLRLWSCPAARQL